MLVARMSRVYWETSLIAMIRCNDSYIGWTYGNSQMSMGSFAQTSVHPSLVLESVLFKSEPSGEDASTLPGFRNRVEIGFRSSENEIPQALKAKVAAVFEGLIDQGLLKNIMATSSSSSTVPSDSGVASASATWEFVFDLRRGSGFFESACHLSYAIHQGLGVTNLKERLPNFTRRVDPYIRIKGKWVWYDDNLKSLFQSLL